MVINMENLCLGDPHHRIRFSLYSNVAVGDDPILYGELITSVKDIQDHEINVGRELINESAKMKYGGTIFFEEFAVINQPSFVEYLKTGWFINLSVAIDFTASNGDLH